MAYPENYRSDPMSGGNSGQMRSDPRSDFRRDIRRDVPAGAEAVENERDDAASAAIERDIDRTRQRMDETVDTLAERLRPSNIISDVLDFFASDEGLRTQSPQRDKVKRVAKRAGRGLWDTVKENPMPTALIAGGIAWLMLRHDSDDAPVSRGRAMRRSAEPAMYGGSYVDARTGQPYDMESYEYERGGYEGDSGPGMTERAREYAGEAWEGARRSGSRMADKAGDMAHRAGDAARSAGDTVRHAGERVGEAAAGAWESARHALSGGMHSARDAAGRGGQWTRHRAGEWSHAAGDLSRSAARRARRMGRRSYAYSRDRFERGLDEYPLAMAAGAIAAGVLVGLSVPRTRREDRLFGSYAHDMKHRAGEAAREVMHRGRAAAEREGLSPESLKYQAKDLAGEVRDSAGRVIREATEAAKDVAGRVAEAARGEARELREEARERGLTPEAMKEKARHIAEETGEAIKEEAGAASDDAKQGLKETQGQSSYGSAFGQGGISTGRPASPDVT